MTVRLRPVLASLPAYVPGRSSPGAIKLASNENPYGPLPHVLDRIAEAAAASNRYPDTNSTELMYALAEKYGVAAGAGRPRLRLGLALPAAGAGQRRHR